MVEFNTAISFAITSSKSIMVGQYTTGYGAINGLEVDDSSGDPAFALLAPTQQYMTEYVFLAPDKYPVDYVVITHPKNLEVLLDDAPVATNANCEIEIFDADWDITRCLIEDFTHTIDAEEPVGITVWGYGGRIAYGVHRRPESERDQPN